MSPLVRYSAAQISLDIFGDVLSMLRIFLAQVLSCNTRLTIELISSPRDSYRPPVENPHDLRSKTRS